MPVHDAAVYDASTAGREGLVLNVRDFSVRDPNSPYGRYMTTFRKQLTEPIVADDGTELNMHEVLEARRLAAAAKHAKRR